jgi:hypothetical protein
MQERNKMSKDKNVKEKFTLNGIDLDDSDLDCMLDFEDMEFQIGHDNKDSENIICCCKKDLMHDETIKFKLMPNKNLAEGKDYLNCTLFKSREEGKLVQQGDFVKNNYIPAHIEKGNIFGRHLDIYETIKFFCDDSSSQRILNLQGIEGVGVHEIVKYSIKYVTSRKNFPDGAFYVNLQNKISKHGFLNALGKTFHLQFTDIQEVSEQLRKLKVILMVDKCEEVLLNDYDNFL